MSIVTGVLCRVCSACYKLTATTARWCDPTALLIHVMHEYSFFPSSSYGSKMVQVKDFHENENIGKFAEDNGLREYWIGKSSSTFHCF